MSDAEAYFKLYGNFVYCVPFYVKNFDLKEVEHG